MQSINTNRREATGKGGARDIRVRGRLPAVIYGHGIESSISIDIDPRDLDRILQDPKGKNALVDLKVGQEHYQVLARELQRHPISRKIIHLDFISPDLEKFLVAEVPVVAEGRAVGVETGGKLRIPYREIKLSSLPAEIPAQVIVDVTELDHNQGVLASELNLPEGIKAVYEHDYLVVKVQPPRGLLDEDAEMEDGEETEDAEETEAEA